MFGQVGHGVSCGRVVGRPRQQLVLEHLGRALADRGAEAVRAGVAAAEDDDTLARRR